MHTNRDILVVGELRLSIYQIIFRNKRSRKTQRGNESFCAKCATYQPHDILEPTIYSKSSTCTLKNHRIKYQDVDYLELQ